MYPKRDAAGHLRRCAKRPVLCALGCGDGAAHSVPEDELAAHVHDAWVNEPARVELQVTRMIVAVAGRPNWSTGAPLILPAAIQSIFHS